MNHQNSSFGMTLCSSDVIENKSRIGYQITGFESKSNNHQNINSFILTPAQINAHEVRKHGNNAQPQFLNHLFNFLV